MAAGPNPDRRDRGAGDVLNQLAVLNGLSPVPPLLGSSSVPDMFVGGYGQSLSNLAAGTFPTVQVGVQFSLPLRNRTAEAQAAISTAEGRRLRALRDQIAMAVEADVRNSLQGASSAQSRLEAAILARRSAEGQYASEQRQFQAGTSTVFLVLQRQSDLIAARGREIRARADLGEAMASLERATARDSRRAGNCVEACSLLPSYGESLSEFSLLQNVSYSPVRNSFPRQWLTNLRPSLWPLNGRLLSPFGARTDPFSGEGSIHTGVIFPPPSAHPFTARPTASSPSPAGSRATAASSSSITTTASALTTPTSPASRSCPARKSATATSSPSPRFRPRHRPASPLRSPRSRHPRQPLSIPGPRLRHVEHSGSQGLPLLNSRTRRMLLCPVRDCHMPLARDPGRVFAPMATPSTSPAAATSTSYSRKTAAPSSPATPLPPPVAAAAYTIWA